MTRSLFLHRLPVFNSVRLVVRVVHKQVCALDVNKIFSTTPSGLTTWCVIIAGWKHFPPQDQEEDYPEEVDGDVLHVPKLADGPDPFIL